MYTDYTHTRVHVRKRGGVDSLEPAAIETEKAAAKEVRRQARLALRAAQSNPATASWYKTNPAKHAAKATAHYRANKEAISAHVAAYRAANAEQIRVARAEYRAKNRAKVLAGKSAWRRAHRDLHRIYDHNRRARIREIGGNLSPRLTARLLQMQKGKCACCQRPLGRGFHVDHIIPLSRRGRLL